MTWEQLHRAKTVVNDEFYTRYEDVDKELVHYARWLKGKSVICPCDDPRKSQIYRWLKDNFGRLGLKRLYSSHLERPRSYWTEYNGVRETSHALTGGGDFLSAEVLALICRADIIITNPPFSLIRQFVGEVMSLHKKFILVAPMTTLYYQNIFPYVKSGRIRTGFNWIRSFDNSSKHFGNVSWITNFPTPFHDPLPLADSISPACEHIGDVNKKGKVYKDVLHVPRLEDIPKNYKGYMAVPQTILSHFNPRQIQIIDHIHSLQLHGKTLAVRVIIRVLHHR